MINPSYKRILALARNYSIIPVYKQVCLNKITPINLLKKLNYISSHIFLLEHLKGYTTGKSYSYLGFDPVMRITCKDSIVNIIKNGKTIQRYTDKPLDVLREIYRDYKSPRLKDLPPFTGGFAGYFAYSMIKYSEPVLKIKQSEFNDFDLMLFDKMIVFDHTTKRMFIIVNMRTDNIEDNYKQAIDDIETIHRIIYDSRTFLKQPDKVDVKFTCNINKEDYCSIIKRAKEYIRNGDIFQVVLSRRFSAPYKDSLINAYKVLSKTNPSPYMVYIKMDKDELICSSPETLVKLNNGRLSTFPVAGSRPRGKTEQEDIALEKELLADEKELSEHNMLVDLSRNDLGKICKYNSVKVTEYMAVHRYSTVMHICSRVEGDILPDCDALSAIQAVLPAGTLSGAPKIRACEIIEELESQARGIYGGALGYIDFTGNMDTCIAIRMAVKKGDSVCVQAGSGIVADSIPENEYQESMNKALAPINAVCKAWEVG